MANPSPQSPPVQSVMTDLASLQTQLVDGESIFAIFDACDTPTVPARMTLHGDAAACLYSGKAKRDYWAIAPYVAKVDEPLLEWCVETVWSDPWGILFKCSADLESVRKHFKRMLVVEGPDGPLSFRFYDPRVLPAYLRSATQEEVTEFFGPVESFLFVSDPEELTEFTSTGIGETGRTLFNKPGHRVAFDQPRIDAIVNAQQLDFIVRLEQHLLETLPDKQWPPSEKGGRPLIAVIQHGIKRARRYQLTREGDVADYIELICTHHDAFQTADPLPVRNFLFDRRIGIAERLTQATEWFETQSAAKSGV